VRSARDVQHAAWFFALGYARICRAFDGEAIERIRTEVGLWR